ncbi:MAG: hypothetical protein U0271_06380 [Polyangiaceae bacterium]
MSRSQESDNTNLPFPERWLAKAAVPPLGKNASGTGTAGSDDAAWDDFAANIVERAVESGRAATKGAGLDVLAAPALDPEPGEPDGEGVQSKRADPSREQRQASKVTTMSESDRPKPSQRRPSLKELAERVSKTPPPPSVAPPSARISTLPAASPASPSPNRVSAPPPSLDFGRPSVPNAPHSAPPSLLTRASAPPAPSTPTPVKSDPPARPSAPPVSAPPPSAAAEVAPAKVVPIESAREKSKSPLPLVLIIGGGIAAAVALFFLVGKGDAPKAQTTATTTSTPTATETAVNTVAAAPTETAAAPTATEAPAPKPDDGAIDIFALADASGSASALSAAPFGTIPPPSVSVATAPTASSKPLNLKPDGTLDEAMQKAAGVDGKTDENPQPASADNRPRLVPDLPAQGSVTAALSRVKGAARACVAGADADSNAVVTFGSSGAVTSVSVGGWASGKSAAGCIQSALRAANVGPFLKPSFSVPIVLRP